MMHYVLLSHIECIDIDLHIYIYIYIYVYICVYICIYIWTDSDIEI